jgi:hypothetical protein
VIVWDGDIPETQAQVQTLPKTPVKKIKVSFTHAEEDELEIEIEKEKEMQALERSL